MARPHPRPLSHGERGEKGLGGDAVADGVGVDIAIVQVGHPLVPVVVIASTQVGLRQQRGGTGDGDLRLKDVMFVTAVGVGVAAFVAEEDRDDASAGRQAVVGAGRDGANAVGELEPGIGGNGLALPGPVAAGGQPQGDWIGAARLALPLLGSRLFGLWVGLQDGGSGLSLTASG